MLTFCYFCRLQPPHKADAEYAYVDAHILATPAIADIDGDGTEELVVPVSYFYDRDYYDSAQNAKELEGLDPSKYIASECTCTADCMTVWNASQFSPWDVAVLGHARSSTSPVSDAALCIVRLVWVVWIVSLA